MIPRHFIIPSDRVHLGELIAHELEVQGNAADLNHIDVSGIANMDILFQDSPFVGDISKWDVSQVTSMARMFNNCVFDGDISKWNVSRVHSMYEMFYKGSFKGDLSNWNTARVESMESMFRGPNNNPTGLEHWNVSGVESFFRMFKTSPFSADLSRWSPRDDTYAEAMLDRPMLLSMDTPFFYHWYRVLSDNQAKMPEHLLVPPQGLECLRPEWLAHFNDVYPIAQGLGLAGAPCARFLQEQWLSLQAPRVDAWALPELDPT